MRFKPSEKAVFYFSLENCLFPWIRLNFPGQTFLPTLNRRHTQPRAQRLWTYYFPFLSSDLAFERIIFEWSDAGFLHFWNAVPIMSTFDINIFCQDLSKNFFVILWGKQMKWKFHNLQNLAINPLCCVKLVFFAYEGRGWKKYISLATFSIAIIYNIIQSLTDVFSNRNVMKLWFDPQNITTVYFANA